MVEQPSRSLILPVKEEGGRLFLTVSPDIKHRFNIDEIRSNMLEVGVGNMRLDRIRDVIREASGRPEDVGPVFTYFDREKEKYITVTVADDDMWALIEVTNWSASEIIADDLRFCLYKAGVIEGINERALDEAVSQREAGKEILAAEAIPPRDGEDAQIEYLVSVTHKPKPKILPDGSVDLKSYDLLVAVQENQLLARKLPAKPAVPGATVRGRPIPAKPPKDTSLSCAKGTQVSENGLELRASYDGSVLRDGKGRLYVEQTYFVRGDLGYSTGNIDCAGDVKIGGDVLSGFSVVATGDVVVHGVVEGARVVSKNGSVMVKGGIHGRQNQAYIQASETVAARFVQEATVFAGDTVMISAHVLDSKVLAGKKVDVSSSHGHVLNSLVQAGEEIIVRNMGGPGSRGTEARIADLEKKTSDIRKELGELEQTIGGIKETLGKLGQTVSMLRNSPGTATQLQLRIKSYIERIQSENEKLKTIEEKKSALKQVLARLLGGRIAVIDTLYPGSTITIAGLSETARDPLRQIVYTVERSELACKPYKG